MTAKPLLRYAIYTRVSSEEGMGQAFTSVDAQSECCEAHITTQKQVLGVSSTRHYSDVGKSGGTMERDGLQTMMADIGTGLIDVIVVYKIDRLTRSLSDFYKLYEVLEQHNVAFVSVTQNLNTTSAMGRVILNIMLSFAQFEREMTSERTRDKIALSRQKGRWAGGRPILGYDSAPGGTLTVNEFEAERVRAIFAHYLELKSIDKLIARLNGLGWKNKFVKGASGRESGAGPFIKTSLARLLQSPIYIGKIAHHDKVYKGLHEAIVDEVIWNRAQAILAENRVCGGSTARNLYGGLLKGIAHCGSCGAKMVHSTTKNAGGVVYRYYTCRGTSLAAKSACRSTLPAEQLEQLVLREVKKRGFDPELVTMIFDAARREGEERIADWNSELRTLERESGWIATELKRQIASREDSSLTCERESAVAAKIQLLQVQIREESGKLVTREQVQAATEDFDPLWRSLTPSERATVMGLIVTRVDYHAKSGDINIHFAEAKNQEAA